MQGQRHMREKLIQAAGAPPPSSLSFPAFSGSPGLVVMLFIYMGGGGGRLGGVVIK